MATPDRPDWTTGNVPVVTGSTLYSNLAAPSGTSTGKISIPGAGRLAVSALYTHGAGGSLVGQVTVDQYANGVLMSTRQLMMWDDSLYQTKNQPQTWLLPVEGQQVELTYRGTASTDEYSTSVLWSSAPLNDVQTISNSGLYPDVLLMVSSHSVAAGSNFVGYVPPAARAVSCSISGAAGKFNGNVWVVGPDGENGALGDVWGQVGISNEVVPFTVYAPLAPLRVSMHNTDTTAHNIDLVFMDAS